MNETSAGSGAGQHGIDPKIAARLDEITSPDYVDPARTNLSALDWVVFFGFLIICCVGFTVWGY